MRQSFKEFLRNNKTDCLFISLLVFGSIVSHWSWFRFGNVLSYGDIFFQYPGALKEALLTNTWIGNSEFGTLNVQLYKLLFNVIWFFLAKVGLQFTDVLRITHLIPIAILGFLSPYILIRHLTKDKLIALVIALFYGSTTPFIMRQYLGHSSIAFVIALAPLILYLFQLALEKNSLRQWFVFIFVYWVGVCYEARIMYIVTIILGIYFLFFGLSSFKKYVPGILASIALFVGLSAFWVLPIALGGFSETIGDVAGRDLFGNTHYSMLTSLALFHDSWTGASPLVFSFQPILWRFWIIPVLTVLFFLFRPNKENKKIITFFGVIWLIGLFLTKQAGAPLTNAFQWLRENIPGFLAFRSGSKFWFVLSLGYTGLLSFGLLWLRKKWHHRLGQIVYIGVVIIIIIFSLWNLKPLILGKIGGMFTAREVPNDYIVLQKYLAQQDGFFRTFWTPTYSRWSISTNQNPAVSNVNIIGTEWKDYVFFKPFYDNWPNNEQIMEIFKIKGANELLDNSSIKYVIVPTQDIANDDDFFIYYGGKENPNIRDWYISELNKISWLKKIDIGTKDLVVYENKEAKPPIFTLNQLFLLRSADNLEGKYDFVNKQLTKEFNFTLDNNSQSTKPLVKLVNLFENLDQKDLDQFNKKITDNLGKLGQGDVVKFYNNKIQDSFYYQIIDDEVKIYTKPRGDLFLNEQKIDSHTAVIMLYQTKFIADEKYYLESDNQFKIIEQGKEQNTSAPKIKFYLIKQDANLINNSSFEDGPWQNEVSDCNKYDDKPIINMTLEKNEKTDGNQSLQLEATRHTACTYQKIKVKENTEYLFSFDYQSPNAKNIVVDFQFEGQNLTKSKESLKIEDTDWHHYFKKMTTPPGAEELILQLNALPTDNKTAIINRYDNFVFFAFDSLNLEKELTLSVPAEKFEKKDLDSIENKEQIFQYQNSEFDYANLIDNPSFETGLWQNKISDCNKYDDINMTLEKNEKTDGNQSLELEAIRHTACTYQKIKVKENTEYLFSFDYQSPNAENVGFKLNYNNNDNKTKNMKETLAVENDQWHHYFKKIKSPDNANLMTLNLYSYNSNGRDSNIVRYDNFQLIEMPNFENQYYLVSDPNLNLKNPDTVEFELKSSTKKIVHIRGATTPFFLAMSESYHNGWRLSLKNDKTRVGDEYHYKLNNSLNTWYVDTEKLCQGSSACVKNSDGSYDMEMVIEFWPQRWFYLGLFISGITLLGGILYLILRRKEKNVTF